MKKLLLLFVPLVFFFSCEEEENNNDNSTTGYNCVNNDCFSEEGGQYTTLDDCLSVCGQNTYYDCTPTGCSENTSGQYTSLENCQESCCENCFIIFVNDYDHDHDHDEISAPIGEFCGDDLADIEAEGFDLMEDYEYVHKGENYFFPAGHYPASELNCE